MSDAPPALRVLLVEDEPRLRDALTRAMRSLEFPVHGVGSAEDALRVLAAEDAARSAAQADDVPPCTDVLMLDLHLPAMSGLELLARLRRDRPALQVIILTGHGDLEAAQTAMRLDAVDFLTKPCALGDLERALAHAQARLHPPELKPRLAPGQEAPWGEDEDGDDKPLVLPEGAAQADPDLPLAEVEKRHILRVLAACGDHRREAAQKLGISLRLLYYRLKQYEK